MTSGQFQYFYIHRSNLSISSSPVTPDHFFIESFSLKAFCDTAAHTTSISRTVIRSSHFTPSDMDEAWHLIFLSSEYNWDFRLKLRLTDTNKQLSATSHGENCTMRKGSIKSGQNNHMCSAEIQKKMKPSFLVEFSWIIVPQNFIISISWPENSALPPALL